HYAVYVNNWTAWKIRRKLQYHFILPLSRGNCMESSYIPAPDLDCALACLENSCRLPDSLQFFPVAAAFPALQYNAFVAILLMPFPPLLAVAASALKLFVALKYSH